MRVRVAALALAVVAGVAGPAAALFVSAGVSEGNTFATATLAPPTALIATAGCSGKNEQITLRWAATVSAFATGYVVHRSATSGGPYSAIALVSGRTTEQYVNGGLAQNTAYHYVLRSSSSAWTSAPSPQASATTSKC